MKTESMENALYTVEEYSAVAKKIPIKSKYSKKRKKVSNILKLNSSSEQNGIILCSNTENSSSVLFSYGLLRVASSLSKLDH